MKIIPCEKEGVFMRSCCLHAACFPVFYLPICLEVILRHIFLCFNTSYHYWVISHTPSILMLGACWLVVAPSPERERWLADGPLMRLSVGADSVELPCPPSAVPLQGSVLCCRVNTPPHLTFMCPVPFPFPFHLSSLFPPCPCYVHVWFAHAFSLRNAHNFIIWLDDASILNLHNWIKLPCPCISMQIPYCLR